MFRMFGLGGSRQNESACYAEAFGEDSIFGRKTPVTDSDGSRGEPTTEAGMLIAGGLGMLEPFGRRQ